MAVTVLHPPRVRFASPADTLPLGVLAVSLVAPVLDLVGVLLHLPVLYLVGAVPCGLAALALLGLAVRVLSPTALIAAVAFAASALLRLAGADEAVLLSLLGVLALGAGGAFRARQPSLSLVDLAGPVDRGVDQPLPERTDDPAPLAPAA